MRFFIVWFFPTLAYFADSISGISDAGIRYNAKIVIKQNMNKNNNNDDSKKSCTMQKTEWKKLTTFREQVTFMNGCHSQWLLPFYRCLYRRKKKLLCLVSVLYRPISMPFHINFLLRSQPFSVKLSFSFYLSSRHTHFDAVLHSRYQIARCKTFLHFQRS